MQPHNLKTSSLTHQRGTFDAGSVPLLVDNGTLAWIINTKSYFIDSPKPVRNKVNGISGDTIAKLKGTVKWKLEDDNRKIHIFILKKTYWTPGASTQVLSPQHMVQQAEHNYPKVAGTGEFTSDRTMTLTWIQRKYSMLKSKSDKDRETDCWTEI